MGFPVYTGLSGNAVGKVTLSVQVPCKITATLILIGRTPMNAPLSRAALANVRGADLAVLPLI